MRRAIAVAVVVGMFVVAAPASADVEWTTFTVTDTFQVTNVCDGTLETVMATEEHMFRTFVTGEVLHHQHRWQTTQTTESGHFGSGIISIVETRTIGDEFVDDLRVFQNRMTMVRPDDGQVLQLTHKRVLLWRDGELVVEIDEPFQVTCINEGSQ